MTNNTRADGPPPLRHTTEYASRRKQELEVLAKRLYRAMLSKGWTNAEFSRATIPHDPEGQGIGRDMIGGYLRAMHMPGPRHVKILSKTLGMPVEELLPSMSALAAIDAGRPPAPPAPISMRTLGDGRAHLNVDLDLPMSTAVKVLALLESDG